MDYAISGRVIASTGGAQASAWRSRAKRWRRALEETK